MKFGRESQMKSDKKGMPKFMNEGDKFLLPEKKKKHFKIKINKLRKPNAASPRIQRLV